MPLKSYYIHQNKILCIYKLQCFFNFWIVHVPLPLPSKIILKYQTNILWYFWEINGNGPRTQEPMKNLENSVKAQFPESSTFPWNRSYKRSSLKVDLD